ncbi:hypothetical protein [Leptolyngbya sp. FACHB-261]|uniref:hypothetical protein n=1 Tax=Leptolyngbya sp. FACHB-261 TaxID=2692806 RepID=UPI0016867050|nr:hypothetical protein [Leptolyngbya sp. FACHB-261]MBD2104396.1 hypothetical protein [Leptolyngbya sp. FACHB-261]
MSQPRTVSAVDDIFSQAHQGSVAAIIQVLNEKLADQGIRTRAVREEGVLQLLCEAAGTEQLEQSSLVERIRQILEAIAPREIRRIKINSRIVREQQLLWLEEINRDPEGQLLWSEEITLAKPSLLKRLSPSQKRPRAKFERTALPLPSPPTFIREKHQFRRGILGGVCLSLTLLLLGWSLSKWVIPNWRLGATEAASVPSAPAPTTPAPAKPEALAKPEATVQPSVAPVAAPAPAAPVAVKASEDAFAAAVSLAERAAVSGQAAQTPAQWLALATQWQQASELMAQVTNTDGRYQTARNRTLLYRQNSEAALRRAQLNRSQPQ